MSADGEKFLIILAIAAYFLGAPFYNNIQKQLQAGREYYASKNPTENTYIPRDVRILCNRKIAEFEKLGSKSNNKKTLEYIEKCRTLLAKN